MDRNKIDEVYVIAFVPVYQISHGISNMLDPFLKPLMEDLVHAFIFGYEVSYPLKTIPEYQSKETETVRLLLLCWHGDHPAQCEVGKFLNQGKCGCRRCKVIGKQREDPKNTHYYYGGNRYHTRYPWGMRILCEEVDMFNVENEKRSSIRKKLASSSGFTGISILHTYLYLMYEFNVIRDTVIDVYHTVPLNVVKKYLTTLLDKELLTTEDLDERLLEFPWTKELKAGRIPTAIGKDRK